MRILQVHNRYQSKGGEDVVVADEARLMTEYGHEVRQWIVTNDELKHADPLKKIRLGLNAVWSRNSYAQMRRIIQEYNPDVVHVHNTFAVLSSAVLKACSDEGIAAVQTSHNYRYVCPNGKLYRDGGICEICVGNKVPLRPLVHGCYRGSKTETALRVAMTVTNNLTGTHVKAVTLHIALTEFMRQRLIASGIPASKVVVKPNFTGDNGPGGHEEPFALFVGRLVPEKGIGTLLAAWRGNSSLPTLRVVGSGPLEEQVRSSERDARSKVEYLGFQDRECVLDLMKRAQLLIFPSEWYEGFGLTIIEAFSTGLPVVASNLGAAQVLVEDGRTGWHYRPGDAQHLAEVVGVAFQNPSELRRRGEAARQEYLAQYTPSRNYEMLLGVYQQAINMNNTSEFTMQHLRPPSH